MLERHLDSETGIISVQATGILTVPEVDENCAALRATIAARREAGHPVRVMYDLTDLPRQDGDLEKYVLGKIITVFEGDDRCALLARDAETKREFRKALTTRYIAVALTRLPAEMWLLFDADRPE